MSVGDSVPDVILKFRISREKHHSGYQWLEQLKWDAAEVVHRHDVLNVVTGRDEWPDLCLDVYQDADGHMVIRLWADRAGERLRADAFSESCTIMLQRPEVKP